MTGLSAIILSYTNSAKIHRMTLDCIRTLIQSEDFISTYELEIIVIESNRNYKADGFAFPENVKVILPEQAFNFHGYLNIGILESSKSFIALCNNDLIFHTGWYTEIIKVKKQLPAVRSFCPVQPKEQKPSGDYEIGYLVRRHIKGWCIVAERTLFNTIGLLDEQFNFYYADDDYAMTLKKHHEQHALVSHSIVEHLGGENTESSKEEGNAEFQAIVNQYPNLPKYLYTEGYSWILNNEKLLEGHLQFHKKWGSIRIISLKNKCFQILSKIGLERLIRW